MKKKLYLIFVFIFLYIAVHAQNDKTDQFTDSTARYILNNIEDLIKQKQNDKYQQSILINFRNKFEKGDVIRVVNEFQNYYEITVDHEAPEGFTGGAEAYRLDKKTGELKMIWHEHPMQFNENTINSEKNDKK